MRGLAAINFLKNKSLFITITFLQKLNSNSAFNIKIAYAIIGFLGDKSRIRQEEINIT